MHDDYIYLFAVLRLTGDMRRLNKRHKKSIWPSRRGYMSIAHELKALYLCIICNSTGLNCMKKKYGISQKMEVNTMIKDASRRREWVYSMWGKLNAHSIYTAIDFCSSLDARHFIDIDTHVATLIHLPYCCTCYAREFILHFGYSLLRIALHQMLVYIFQEKAARVMELYC